LNCYCYVRKVANKMKVNLTLAGRSKRIILINVVKVAAKTLQKIVRRMILKKDLRIAYVLFVRNVFD